jgi:hypothetical protein
MTDSKSPPKNFSPSTKQRLEQMSADRQQKAQSVAAHLLARKTPKTAVLPADKKAKPTP